MIIKILCATVFGLVFIVNNCIAMPDDTERKRTAPPTAAATMPAATGTSTVAVVANKDAVQSAIDAAPSPDAGRARDRGDDGTTVASPVTPAQVPTSPQAPTTQTPTPLRPEGPFMYPPSLDYHHESKDPSGEYHDVTISSNPGSSPDSASIAIETIHRHFPAEVEDSLWSLDFKTGVITEQLKGFSLVDIYRQIKPSDSDYVNTLRKMQAIVDAALKIENDSSTKRKLNIINWDLGLLINPQLR